MTTNNIKFLREMNMTMKQDTDRMRCGWNTADANSIFKGRKCHTYAPQTAYLAGLNTILAKAMLMVLLFLAGGAVNGAWVVNA